MPKINNMRKQIFIFFTMLIVCSGNFIAAQTTFQKTYGGSGSDYGFSVMQTTDGGFIICGKTVDYLSSSTYYTYLVRLDSNGDTLWTKKIRASGNDEGRSVQQTTDGGFIITGGSTGAISLIKTDINGNTMWIKLFNANLPSMANNVQQTVDGGFIVVGYLYSLVSLNYDVYLIKTDINGDSLWTKCIGGASADKGNYVQQTTDGGFIIAGETESFGAGNFDIYLIKIDLNGDTLWTKTLGGTGEDIGNSIKQTSDGGYIITGKSSGFGSGSWDSYLIKVDNLGNPAWVKTYGSTSSDRSNSVYQTNDDGFVLVGATNGFGLSNYDVFLIKTNINGDTLWTKIYGDSYGEEGFAVQQTSDGGYIVLGSTSGFGAGSSDVYLIKTDSLGNSGCHQGNPATIVTLPTIQVTNPMSQLYSTPTSISTPSIIFGGNTTVNTLCLTVNINDANMENTFSISPNPSSGKFNIYVPNNLGKFSVEVMNSQGMIIFSDILIKNSMNEINLRSISEGLYFINVFDGVNYYRKKLIIVNN